MMIYWNCESLILLFDRGVIHQLCRVLVLLNKTDPRASIPSDAPGLLQWAHQMLEDYQLDAHVRFKFQF